MKLRLRKKMTVIFIGFLNGLRSVNQLVMFYYYKEILFLSVVSLQMVQPLITFPWLLKPLLGFFTDNFPILGYRRKSYLLIIMVVEALLYFYLAMIPHNVSLVMIVHVLTIFCFVFKNVLAESIVVELTHEKQRQMEQKHPKPSENPQSMANSDLISKDDSGLRDSANLTVDPSQIPKTTTTTTTTRASRSNPHTESNPNTRPNSNDADTDAESQEQSMAVSHVSLFFGATAAGSLVFSYLGGIALQKLSKSQVLTLLGCFPVILFFYVLIIYEESRVTGEPEDVFAGEIETIIHSHLELNYSNLSTRGSRVRAAPKHAEQKDASSQIHTDSEKTHNPVFESNDKTLFSGSEKVSFEVESGAQHEKRSKKQFEVPENNKMLSENSDSKKNSFEKSRLESPRSPNPAPATKATKKGFLESFRTILLVLKHPKITRVILIVNLVLVTPSLSSTWNYYFTNVIKLTPKDLGDITFMASCGYLVGIIAMNTVFSDVGLKSFYRVTTLLSSCLLPTGLFLLFDWYKALHVDPLFFCAINSLVYNFVSELNILPILALCCRFCPKGLEAMSYAFFMSVLWVAIVCSQAFGALVLLCFGVSQHDFSSFWKCVIFQTCFGFFVAVLVSVLYFPKEFNDVNKFIKSRSKSQDDRQISHD